MNTTERQMRRLEEHAKSALNNSYSPYSKFKVGAAVLSGSGKMYKGSNVENASFGLTICAERAAIFAAINAGETEIKALSLCSPTGTTIKPCGACLQVISEFVKDDLYMTGVCKKSKDWYGGFLRELYNDKFTSERFTF